MPDKVNAVNSTVKNRTVGITAVGILIVAVILVFGTMWMGRSASKDTEDAVRSVSLFYLNELAGRREQVIESNLENSINNLQVALGLMDENDLSSEENLQSYQARTKELYGLEKFAFVDENGIMHTANGTIEDTEQYPFIDMNIEEPVIKAGDLKTKDNSVFFLIPVEGMQLDGIELKLCFAEMSMDRMLKGVSVSSDENDATFCNIYTRDGVALTNMVLGGLAREDNLLDALGHADFESGYSQEQVIEGFDEGREGVVSFTYGDIRETLYYVPINNTDWMLTYLIRESVITEQISSISRGTIIRSIIQTILTGLVLLIMFLIMFRQMRKSAQLLLEKETSEAENRVKQQELESRLQLQEELLEKEKLRVQQDKMITAMASDYRSVYYADLDNNEGICYRADHKLEDSLKEGEHFNFHERFARYAEKYVTEDYREEFLKFVDIDEVRIALESELIHTMTYLVRRNGTESYEMLRMAGVRHAEDRDDHIVHAIGLGFTDVDKQTREAMEKNQILSDALKAAEEANKAKTAFLSNMSHEIRTPMNAIIGLDNIAMNDPDISDKTREYLEKIDQSANHLLTIINDILDMSRIESGRMILNNKEFSMSRLLEQINTIISGQCSDKGLEYNCRINGYLDDYYIGDDIKLRQVILNILGNAVKFTPEGGKVDFEVEKVNSFDGKTSLRMVFSDTGIGMEKEYLSRIFDAFSQEDSSSTSKYGSSGLGLAITRNIVELMNGSIKVESEKGKGSTFTVSVTLMNAKRKDSADGSDDAQIDPNSMSVLIIDDDPVACEHGKLVLEKAGIAAETVQSGKEAIEMIQLRHARRNPYNLILVDWKMPEMDGVETTRRIRESIGDESAIIILTAYRWDDIIGEAEKAGVDSFLAKPLFASSVLEEFTSVRSRKNISIDGSARKADLKGRKILLAEDVAINAEIIMMLLAAKEMEVEHAENGKIAVDMFESHPENYYDAVLMDMRMPEMDGLTATQTIRALDREDAKTIPIIALTANAFDEDVQRSLQAGLNAHLSKPVEPDNLIETLESLIKD